jgi:hypothetical protein
VVVWARELYAWEVTGRARALVACASLLGCTGHETYRVSIVIEAGAPVDARPRDGGSTRDVAVDSGHPEGGPDAAPSATTLALSLPLVPPFSTSIYDYYVRCADTTNTLDVTMTAAPGSTIALTQPVATTPSVKSTAHITVEAGAPVVVSVETGSRTVQYFVRCLPSDFATLEMTLHPDGGTPPAGYYLAGDLLADDARETGYAMMLDSHGVPVWYGKTTSGVEAVDVDNLIPGIVSFTPYLDFTFADAATGEFELKDLSAGTSSFVDSVGAPLDLHELRALPNGDFLVLASPILTGVDLTGLSTLGTNQNMVDCVIQEVSPQGVVVWDWDAMDHFDPIQDCTYPIVKTVSGQMIVNAFHCNSIDVDSVGDLLVGARNMDSVFLVEKATGAVQWKMGGATYTRDGASYIKVQGDPLTSFYRQHDVRLLPDGNISMFDDHTDMPGAARAVIYSYDVAAGTATMIWQYQGTQPSSSMGSFRILADGSRVVGWGSNPSNVAFSEVDEAGSDLMDFRFLDERWTYRAIKVPVTAFDIDVLRATAGR